MPTLHVYKTNNHLYCQVVQSGNIILHSSTVNSPDLQQNKSYGNTIEAAESMARNFSKLLTKQNLSNISLHRRKFRYHGRIKSFIDVLRQQGISVL